LPQAHVVHWGPHVIDDSLVCCLWQDELGRLVLKRFLLLVLLMDRAAMTLANQYRTPLLFRLAGTIKSSKQVSCTGLSTVSVVPWMLQL